MLEVVVYQMQLEKPDVDLVPTESLVFSTSPAHHPRSSMSKGITTAKLPNAGGNSLRNADYEDKASTHWCLSYRYFTAWLSVGFFPCAFPALLEFTAPCSKEFSSVFYSLCSTTWFNWPLLSWYNVISTVQPKWQLSQFITVYMELAVFSCLPHFPHTYKFLLSKASHSWVPAYSHGPSILLWKAYYTMSK